MSLFWEQTQAHVKLDSQEVFLSVVNKEQKPHTLDKLSQLSRRRSNQLSMIPEILGCGPRMLTGKAFHVRTGLP